MTRRARFFLPGPAYVRPEILALQLQQPVAHRSAAFAALYGRLEQRLPLVFRSSDPVVVATGSGTLMLECTVVSLVERRVLNLVCGAFSARWHAISVAAGLAADRVEVPFGEAVDPELVRAALRRQRYDAVTMVHCETSTGVLNPVASLAAVVKEESDSLVLVDAVSSLGGARLETAEWGLDAVVTASQKALALPPGLALASVSGPAQAQIPKVSRRGFYTDLGRYLEHHRGGGTITTPAVTLCHALDVQLGEVLEEGIEARWRRHEAMRDRTLAWASERGFTAAAREGVRSPTVTTLRPPEGVDADALVAALAAEGYTVGRGYGPWKGSTFRIGHMGDVGLDDLEGLFEMCEALVDRI